MKRYELLNKQGKGAYGVVFKAMDKKTAFKIVANNADDKTSLVLTFISFPPYLLDFLQVLLVLILLLPTSVFSLLASQIVRKNLELIR